MSQVIGFFRIFLIPEYGTYYMVWKKHLVVITHSKETQANSSRPKPAHTMRVQIWFAWSRSLLLEIIAEAMESFAAAQPARLLSTEQHDQANSGLTMAELLNAIDAIGANEDRLLFMTANRPELLDTALIRAGRVDRNFISTMRAMRSCGGFIPVSHATSRLSRGRFFTPRCPKRQP